MFNSYKIERICDPLFNSLQGFRQCRLTSKVPCFYRNRHHGSSFPTRRVRCSVVQLTAPRHPRSAGLIRQTKSSLTCPVSGEYSAYTSKEGYTAREYLHVPYDFHEDVNSNKREYVMKHEECQLLESVCLIYSCTLNIDYYYYYNFKNLEPK
jgi:hypothetical protein